MEREDDRCGGFAIVLWRYTDEIGSFNSGACDRDIGGLPNHLSLGKRFVEGGRRQRNDEGKHTRPLSRTLRLVFQQNLMTTESNGRKLLFVLGKMQSI